MTGARPDDDAAGDAPGPVPDVARAVLSRMRAAARATGGADLPRMGRSSATRQRRKRAPGQYSGPGPDDRDPRPLGGAWTDLVVEQGWTSALDVARLNGMWSVIVGEANAEHATPESFDPRTGALVIRTTSTAWAEQLRLMMPALRAAIDGQVGPGVVGEITLVGPAPPRTRGRLRVRGRGPRDTYG